MLKQEIQKFTRNRVVVFLSITLLCATLLLAWNGLIWGNEKGLVTYDSVEDMRTAFESETSRIIAKSSDMLKDAEHAAAAFGEDRAYATEYYNNVISLYGRARETITIKNGSTEGWNLFLDGEYILFVSLLFAAVVGAVSVFEEKRIGAMPILFCSKYGRTRAVVSKTATVVLLSSGFCLLASLLTLLFYAFSGKLGNGFAELQTVAGFLSSPYGLSVVEAAAVVTAHRIAVCALVGVGFSFFSSLLGSYVLIFASGALPVIGEFFLFRLELGSADVFVKNVNLFAFGSSYLLKRYYGVRLFGCSGALQVSGILLVILLVGTGLASYFVFRTAGYVSRHTRGKRRLAAGGISNLLSKERNYRGKTLFGWEMRKITGRPAVILLLVAFLALQGYVSFRQLYVNKNQNEQIYEQYCRTYSEHTLEDVRKMIQSETARIEEGIETFRETADRYSRGEISSEEYEEKWNEHGYCLAHRYPNERCADRLTSLLAAAQSSGDHVLFVYDSGWNALLGSDFQIGIVLILILLLSPSVAREYETGMTLEMRPTRYGDARSFLAKTACAATIASLAFLITAVFSFAFLGFGGLLDHPFASVHSLDPASGFPYEISIASYVVILFLVKWLSYLLFSLFVLSLSALTRKTVGAISISLAAVLIPYALNALLDFPEILDPSSYMAGNRVLLTGGHFFPGCLLLSSISFSLLALAYFRFLGQKRTN